MKRREVLGAAAGAAGAVLGRGRRAVAAEPVLQKTDLWRAGEDGYVTYRIPGIVSTASGALLAYCEARKNSRADWGQIDVMIRRSTDDGRTWTPSRKITDPEPKNAARMAETTINNPVAIAGNRGATHFLFCVEYARCYAMRSEDEGETWSKAANITTVFELFRREYPWKVIATGPGHGIRTRAGRLIVPVWMAAGANPKAHRPSRVATIYSDDDGATWQPGAILAGPMEPLNPSEMAVAELSDGRVMLNIRHESPQRLRAVTVSRTGIGEWSPLRYDPFLPEPVCMGSLLSVSARPKPLLLFSNPHNPTGKERRNLTVKLSGDEGETWSRSLTLEYGPSAYSDLTQAADGDILCLYERGSGDQAALTLARFNLRAFEI